MPLQRDDSLRVHVLCSWLVLATGGFSYASLAYASEVGDVALVEILGGADFSGHEYTWTVTNRHTSPLVYLALPGYRVGVVTVPEDWTFKRIAPGLVATAGPGAGIATGRNATFTMRVNPRGTKRGHGEVIARFGDGKEYVIRDVEAAQPETSAETFMPLFGLAMMLVVVILVRRKRSRSRSESKSEPAGL